jgi:hypothetical protein
MKPDRHHCSALLITYPNLRQQSQWKIFVNFEVDAATHPTSKQHNSKASTVAAPPPSSLTKANDFSNL